MHEATGDDNSKAATRSRIALLFEYPSLNGGERSMLAVLDRLHGTSVEWEFLAIAPPNGRLAEALKQRSISVFPLNFHDEHGQRLPRKVILERLTQIVIDSRPDIIHANSLSMGRLTGAMDEKLNVRRIAHLRDIIRLSKSVIADLNRNGRLLAVSQATKDFHTQQGLDSQRTTVLYNGVDCDDFQPRPKNENLQTELGLPSDAFVTLTIGQIGLRKGWDVIADALVRLKDSVPTLHAVFAGQRHSSKPETVEYERNMKRRFDEAGMSEQVHFLGYREDISMLMNTADILIHAAHQEPLGRVLLEAASSGLPVLATNVGGTSEILQHEKSAVLVPAGDSDCLVDAFRMLQSDSHQREELARNARETIEDRFSIQQATENLAAIWKNEQKLSGPPE